MINEQWIDRIKFLLLCYKFFFNKISYYRNNKNDKLYLKYLLFLQMFLFLGNSFTFFIFCIFII